MPTGLRKPETANQMGDADVDTAVGPLAQSLATMITMMMLALLALLDGERKTRPGTACAARSAARGAHTIRLDASCALYPL